jgi:hypothetical protein
VAHAHACLEAVRRAIDDAAVRGHCFVERLDRVLEQLRVARAKTAHRLRDRHEVASTQVRRVVVDVDEPVERVQCGVAIAPVPVESREVEPGRVGIGCAGLYGTLER